MADTTIIIPTHERPQYLRRIVDFLSPSDNEILVVDSSPESCRNILPSNVRYFHKPDLYLTQKILFASKEIHTSYAAICADDDFLTVSGIEQASQFLSENPHYACAQGLTMTYIVPDQKTVCFFPKYQHLALARLQINPESSDPKIRLTSAFCPFLQWIYAVHRVDALRQTSEILCAIENPPRCFTDRVFSFGLAISGNLKLLPILFSVREHAPMSVPANEKFCVLRKSANPAIQTEFQMLTQHLHHQWDERIGDAPAIEWLESLFDLYCRSIEPENSPKSPERGSLEQVQINHKEKSIVRCFSPAIRQYGGGNEHDIATLRLVSEAVLGNFTSGLLVESKFPGQINFDF